MIIANIFLLLILIALNAFFVAVEFAIVAARRARLDTLVADNPRRIDLVRSWLERPTLRDRLIAANQLGITVVSLALGAVGENTFQAILNPLFASAVLPGWLHFLEAILPGIPLVLSLIIITSLHVVLGEQVPKVAVLRGPEKFAVFAAPLMQIFNFIFKPFVDILDWLARFILRLFGLKAGAVFVYTVEELKEIVTGPEVEGVIDPPQREMLLNVIDFGDLVVRQVSVPRTEIIAVPIDMTVQEAAEVAVEHAITKLPVYEENLDQVIGIVHLRDMVRALQAGEGTRLVNEIKRDVLFVPETISVNDLLHQFRTHHTHLAIMLDEFGGTNGLVTLEDLLEEIVGEVSDPYDDNLPEVQEQADGSYLVDGMLPIEEVNEHFHLELHDPHYDTLAGYILGRLGRIPAVGDVYEDLKTGICFKIISMDRMRISQVSLVTKPKETKE
jgi:putative hemolysin